MNKTKTKKAKKMNMNTFKLLMAGCGVGVAAALTAVAYRYALGFAEEARTGMFESVNSPLGAAAVFAVLIILGLITGYITQKEPMIKGSGIPQVKGQLLGYFAPSWLSIMIKKFITGTLCIFAGLSLGREGPSVQLGAMAGQGFAEVTGINGGDRKYLIVCGACAGLAAAFNAPLAGLMFALEEIHKNFSRKAIFPAMAAAMCADAVSKLFFGTDAVLHMVQIEMPPMKYYLLYIVLGAVCGVFGAIYNKTLFVVQKLYKKIPVSDTIRIAIPFAIAGVVGFTFPAIMGGGHGLIDMLAGGTAALSLMIMLLIGKFIFSMISFCSGAPGGIFFPLLVLGALAGSIVGRVSVMTLGIPESYVVNFMLLGMAGLFSGIVRAPLTGIVLVAEMSGSFTQFMGLAMVSCVSWLVAYMLKSRPVYEQMLDNIAPDHVGTEEEELDTALMEMVIPFGSPVDGVSIKNLGLPANCHIVDIERRGVSLIPNGSTYIKSGDVLKVAYKVGYEKEVRNSFGIN